MKKRFMAGMLAMSIMFMGAGYAAWSQSFVVTNTVNTGELRFEYDVENKTDAAQKYTELKVEKNAEGNIVGVIEKAYPGATYTYEIAMTNESTMGVIPVFTDATEPSAEYDALDYKVEYLVNEDAYTAGNVVEPGQNLKAVVTVSIPTTANEENFKEKGSISFTNNFTFNQFNAN